MKVQNWERFLTDYRNYVDQVAKQRQVRQMIGLKFRKPYSQASTDKLNDLLDAVRRDELVIDVHETEGSVSVLAYSPLRRGGRQQVS
jgi:hypothetical protein